MLNFFKEEFIVPFKRWPFWLVYGWRDVRAPYGRTIFGPLAITIQTAVWVAFIYTIFKDSLGSQGNYYAVYLAHGYPTFIFFQSCIIGGQSLLTRNSGLITNIKLPFLLFSLRYTIAAALNLFFAHLVLYYLLISGASPYSINWLTSLAWYLAYLPLGVFISTVAAFLGVFVPNLMVLVGAITRFLFFATPILWYVEAREGFRFLVAQINPIAHYINLVRKPLLGEQIPLLSIWVYLGSLSIAVLATIIALKYLSHRVIMRV